MSGEQGEGFEVPGRRHEVLELSAYHALLSWRAEVIGFVCSIIQT
jgi:hypothetical protein